MGRRSDQGCIIVVGVISVAASILLRFITENWWIFLLVVIALGVLIFLSIVRSEWSQNKRREQLTKKYHDVNLVSKILSGTIWQGQTAEQLIDSIGPPQAIDTQTLRTKLRETWKYGHKGGNRYILRVTLENRVVTGWAQKS